MTVALFVLYCMNLGVWINLTLFFAELGYLKFINVQNSFVLFVPYDKLNTFTCQFTIFINQIQYNRLTPDSEYIYLSTHENSIE